jgi:alpha-glucoside transport system substrate-binding protein
MELGWSSRDGGRPCRGKGATVASLLLCAILVSACSAGATASPAASTAASASPAASTAASASPAASTAVDLHGKVVTISALYTGPDADNWLKSLKPLEDRTGIVIKYSGSRDAPTQLAVSVEAGTPPDIGITATPGVIQGWASKIPPLPADIVATANATLDKGWITLGSGPDGSLLGLPDVAEVKSLVWYSNKYFAQYGYTVPTTWADFTALQDRMVKDGHTPWCIGIESGDATGWPFTDWMEDWVLRTYGPDFYDQWVKHEIKFTDPRIKAVAQAVSDIWFKPGYVLQKRSQIASTAFQDAGLPILDGKCMMYRMANFYNYYFVQAKATSGPNGDVNAFYLPPMNDTYGKPLEISGNYAIAFTNKPETVEVMRYFASPEYWNTLIKSNGVLSPNKTTDASLDPIEIDRVFDKILATSGPVRFDASDAMPSAVGLAFYRESAQYVSGQETLDQMLANIESKWPK